MSTGGVFQIITNDGKQDRMLMATALLHNRLKDINKDKARQNTRNHDTRAPENLPTLLDIERTHILFMNAHFKPFAAMGYEYNKVRPASGNPTLGQKVQFSIPQFGDFFHDIACHVVLGQPTLSIDAGTAASDEPTMRWCHFPGERLLQRVSQEVNGNPLDEYTNLAINMHREFLVQPNKRLGWDRCVGQQEDEKGWIRQPDWASSGVGSAAVTHRVGAAVQTGAQTPTGQKVGDLELFIPLLFWYNKDVRLAVPSVAIPFGQRFINIDLAPLDELVNVVPRGAGTNADPNGSLTESTPTLKSIELYINNIFVNPEVHKIYIKRIGFSLIRVHRYQTYSAESSTGEVHLQQLKWPIEYLFVGLKVRAYNSASDAATKRANLDKWHLFHSRSTGSYKTDGQNVLKESLLVADPTATLGLVALDGTLSGTATLAQAVAAGDALRIAGSTYTVTVGAAAGAAVTDVTVAGSPGLDIAASAANAADSAVVAYQGLEYQTDVCTKTLTNISIKAHGVNIYDNFPSGFFNAYLPYHYGGGNMNTPEDCGACLIPFCLFPGTYQPSGHINVSRAREFYINYSSTVIGTAAEGRVPGTLVVIASAINFLLISDGSAVLRYST